MKVQKMKMKKTASQLMALSKNVFKMKFSNFCSNIFILCLLCNSLSTASCKQFKRCELAKDLVEKYEINKTFLSNWVCLVEHESNSDTQKVTRMPDGSAKYGLFQISSKNYCSIDRKGGVCNRKCADFLDNNIADDVECAKKIFDTEGFKHWRGWNNSCRDTHNLPQLSVLCRNINSPSPSLAKRLFHFNI